MFENYYGSIDMNKNENIPSEIHAWDQYYHHKAKKIEACVASQNKY